MNRIIAALCLTLASPAWLTALADDDLAFLHGEWASDPGVSSESDGVATVRHAWAPVLGGQFTRLEVDDQVTDKDGQPTSFQGVAHYRSTGNQSFDGFWADSSGDLLPICATLDGKTLTATWGSDDSKLGRSIYQQLPDGTLLAVNSLRTNDGEWLEFGRAILKRTPTEEESGSMAKVTGIGGVFLKSSGDANSLSSWYREHLGLSLEGFGGSILKWEDDQAEDNGITVWHVADSKSEWFSPSDSAFMINYRVDDLEALLRQLRASGIEILQGPEYHENGVFAWIMDPDGNKVELWEPKIWDDANKKAVTASE